MARIGIIIIVLGVLVAGAASLAKQYYEADGPLEERIIVHIAKGSGVGAIADRLKFEGVISSEDAFKVAARLRGDGGQLKAGDYEFDPGVSLKGVMDALVDGKSVEYRITVAEGLTTAEALDLVKENKVLVGEITSKPAEGALAPDTYFVQRGETRDAVVERMKSAQAKILAQAWENRVEGLPIKSPVEALILASIIEKETGVASERREVASVFVNRLRKGMKLETDPTVIYGITRGAGPLGRELTRKDVRTPTDYNTYSITGLPPTPIANPGKASIEAAVNPATTPYFFFVADGTGGHGFSKTLAEHNRKVAKWRKIRAKQRAEERRARAAAQAKN